MAIGIHVAFTRFVGVDSAGNVVNKSDPATTIRHVLSTTHEHRVIPDPGIANSAGNPTIKEYLELEASINYVIGHVSQNMIVTYDSVAINNAH